MKHQIQCTAQMGSREQQTSKGMQEKVVTLRANKIRKALDYTKLENPLFVGQGHEVKQPVMNHTEQSLRSMKDKDDDGLVKHMRNLPGFLQRAEIGEDIQGKALNFGVLDWGRLENWKSNEKRIPPKINMKTSPRSSNNPILVESGSARLPRTRRKIHPPRKDQHSSSCSELNSSCKERLSPGVRWPRHKAVKAQTSERSPVETFHGTQSPRWKDLSLSKGKQTDQMTSEKDKASATKMPSEDNINHTDDPCTSGNVNARLSSPRDGTKIKSSSQELWLSDCRSSCDGHLIEADESRLSNCFSPTEFHSLNPFSQVPHSCPFPLPLSTETDPECSAEVQVTLNESVIEDLTRAFKKCDDVVTDEHSVVKGRQSSPIRRFSFSLGKMTRSFSFKESSSVVPQPIPTYTSVKSGPVSFEASPDLVNHSWKKGNATNASRSSPLRRLLDPLLKLKGSHSAEKVPKPKLDVDSASSASVNENETFRSVKYRSTNVQALLQLQLKNGIPFFKLVVESSSDILIAAVKKFPSGKDDSSLIYAFYSVHENKKKKKKNGGWMYQGSKEKGFGFAYNVIGQMRICSSYRAEFSGSEKDLYVVRESVLYSSDSVQADEKTLVGEEAAIVVKNPSDEIHGDIGRSKSMVVVLPEGVHTMPNGARPSPLINRWRSGGGECDCGGWDIGCQFHVLSHRKENIKTPSPSNRLDLSYQGGGGKKKCNFSLVSLEDGLYSLEYDPSMSLLQAFSVCVAVVSSQKLTHIFQVNYVPDEKLKSWDETSIPAKYVSKPPASPVGRV